MFKISALLRIWLGLCLSLLGRLCIDLQHETLVVFKLFFIRFVMCTEAVVVLDRSLKPHIDYFDLCITLRGSFVEFVPLLPVTALVSASEFTPFSILPGNKSEGMHVETPIEPKYELPHFLFIFKSCLGSWSHEFPFFLTDKVVRIFSSVRWHKPLLDVILPWTKLDIVALFGFGFSLSFFTGRFTLDWFGFCPLACTPFCSLLGHGHSIFPLWLVIMLQYWRHSALIR